MDLLARTLSGFAASVGADGELVVVESGETGAADLVDGLACPTTVLRAPRPGKSRQLNIGVRAARSEVIVCTDDDCEVDPAWATAMAAPFDDPEVGIVFGPVAGLSTAGGVDGPADLSAGPAPEVTWRYANGAAMAVRRRAVIEIGGYDERLGPGAPQHGEEHDLVLRAQEAGWRVVIADAPVVRHVDWRSAEEDQRNLRVYSRGAGAFVGAALRRRPRRWWRLALRRARYQARLWRLWREEGITFGPSTTVAFVGGLLAGLRMRPQRFVEAGWTPPGEDSVVRA